MSAIGEGLPDNISYLVSGQRGRDATVSPISSPGWQAETAERNENRFGGFLLAVGLSAVVWGALAIGFAAFLLLR